ncbi:hypothetical protein LUZ60_016675 [Juncus effusus]|nr:hypothetical protein LUZ60_016675 [Juncus effusus]
MPTQKKPVLANINEAIKNMQGLPPLSRVSMFRVPEHIKKNNEKHYEPRLIAIGPYHRTSNNLKVMEEHKWWYLKEFLEDHHGAREDEYVEAMRNLVPMVKETYWGITDLENEALALIFLLDGCFILKLLIKLFFQGNLEPVFDGGWGLPLLITDLLMLENQIPFTVLDKLYEIYARDDESRSQVSNILGTTRRRLIRNPSDPLSNPDPSDSTNNTKPSNSASSSQKPSLYELIDKLLRVVEPGPSNPPQQNVIHLLHFYHLLFVPKPNRATNTVISNNEDQARSSNTYKQMRTDSTQSSIDKHFPKMIPSASELEEFGVRFKEEKRSTNFLTVSFEPWVFVETPGRKFKKVLRIPFMKELRMPCTQIDESTKTKYMNLIAFEQCNGNTVGKNLTSYLVLMCCLINTAQDVLILQRSGILQNNLRNADEAAKFFGQLNVSCYLNFEEHYLA